MHCGWCMTDVEKTIYNQSQFEICFAQQEICSRVVAWLTVRITRIALSMKPSCIRHIRFSTQKFLHRETRKPLHPTIYMHVYIYILYIYTYYIYTYIYIYYVYTYIMYILCIYIYIYYVLCVCTYMAIDLNSFICKRPFFANIFFANLSRTPCLFFAEPMLSNNSSCEDSFITCQVTPNCHG